MTTPSRKGGRKPGPAGTTRDLLVRIQTQMKGTGEHDLAVALATVADDAEVPVPTRLCALRRLSGVLSGKWLLTAAEQGFVLDRESLTSRNLKNLADLTVHRM